MAECIKMLLSALRRQIKPHESVGDPLSDHCQRTMGEHACDGIQFAGPIPMCILRPLRRRDVGRPEPFHKGLHRRPPTVDPIINMAFVRSIVDLSVDACS
jgi:hypothetical protein